MNRRIFYDQIRQTIFDSKIKQSQVNGIEAILNEWEVQKLEDNRWLSYMLATTYHETDKTMQPIREYDRGHGRKYGVPDPDTGLVYYGRGFVQLTWKSNYQKMSVVTGEDLVHDPDKALMLPAATKILFYGMIHGSFTTVKLSDYFNEKKTDWVNARRIINGTDKAILIAGYAKKFYNALI